MTKTNDTRGRMIRAYQDEHALEDLALVDTLRAAAPYQRLRAAVKVEQETQSTQSLPLEQQEAKGLSIVIKPQDYRRKSSRKNVLAHISSLWWMRAVLWRHGIAWRSRNPLF